MLDRAARSTVRNFSTLFLIVLIVMLPLEMAYSFVHRHAIAVRELTPYIEEMRPGERVNGVGAAELDRAERDRFILNLVELGLLPLLISPTRRVLVREREDELPTATDAYRHGFLPPRIGPLPAPSAVGAVATAVVFAFLLGFAAFTAGKLLAELFPDRVSFVIVGSVGAVARSLAVPWFLVAWVESAARRSRTGGASKRPATPFGRPPEPRRAGDDGGDSL